MQGATCTPAGSTWPPTSNGATTRRAAIESTGRTRSTSLTTASRVGVVAVAHAGLRLGMVGEALERPGERAGRRLVPGGEHGHDLVAQLLAGDARGPEHGEQRALGVAAAVELAREQGVDVGDGAQERAPRAAAVQRHRDEPRQRGGHVERAADRCAQLRPLDRAEHDAQDHVERERLHPRQRAQLAGGPARGLGGRQLRDRGAPARERLPVEGR